MREDVIPAGLLHPVSGGRLSAPCLFAGRERELLAEMERRAFDVDITFLEDYA